MRSLFSLLPFLCFSFGAHAPLIRGSEFKEEKPEEKVPEVIDEHLENLRIRRPHFPAWVLAHLAKVNKEKKVVVSADPQGSYICCMEYQNKNIKTYFLLGGDRIKSIPSGKMEVFIKDSAEKKEITEKNEKIDFFLEQLPRGDFIYIPLKENKEAPTAFLKVTYGTQADEALQEISKDFYHLTISDKKGAGQKILDKIRGKSLDLYLKKDKKDVASLFCAIQGKRIYQKLKTQGFFIDSNKQAWLLFKVKKKEKETLDSFAMIVLKKGEKTNSKFQMEEDLEKKLETKNQVIVAGTINIGEGSTAVNFTQDLTQAFEDLTEQLPDHSLESIRSLEGLWLVDSYAADYGSIDQKSIIKLRKKRFWGNHISICKPALDKIRNTPTSFYLDFSIPPFYAVTGLEELLPSSHERNEKAKLVLEVNLKGWYQNSSEPQRAQGAILPVLLRDSSGQELCVLVHVAPCEEEVGNLSFSYNRCNSVFSYHFDKEEDLNLLKIAAAIRENCKDVQSIDFGVGINWDSHIVNKNFHSYLIYKTQQENLKLYGGQQHTYCLPYFELSSKENKDTQVKILKNYKKLYKSKTGTFTNFLHSIKDLQIFPFSRAVNPYSLLGFENLKTTQKQEQLTPSLLKYDENLAPTQEACHKYGLGHLRTSHPYTVKRIITALEDLETSKPKLIRLFQTQKITDLNSMRGYIRNGKDLAKEIEETLKKLAIPEDIELLLLGNVRQNLRALKSKNIFILISLSNQKIAQLEQGLCKRMEELSKRVQLLRHCLDAYEVGRSEFPNSSGVQKYVTKLVDDTDLFQKNIAQYAKAREAFPHKRIMLTIIALGGALVIQGWDAPWMKYLRSGLWIDAILEDGAAYEEEYEEYEDSEYEEEEYEEYEDEDEFLVEDEAPTDKAETI